MNVDAAARHIPLACYPSQPHAHGAFPRLLARAAARAEARVASYMLLVPVTGLQVDTGGYLEAHYRCGPCRVATQRRVG